MTGSATQRPVAFIASLGLLGGGALITVAWNTSRGTVILVPYALIVLVSAVFLRVERVARWRSRFAMALGSFMVATVVFYVFAGTVLAKTLFKIPLWGHAWRLGLMLAIGAALAAAVAQLTATKPARES